MSSFLRFTLIVLLLTPQISFGFDGIDYSDENNYWLGFSAGAIFPFGIVGVRDKYPGGTITLVQPGYIFSAFEYGFFAANANGVTFYQGSVSGRSDFTIFEAAKGYTKMGLDYNFYKRKRTTLTEYDFNGIVGGHIGFGSIHEASDNMVIRSEFKFNFNPGSFLYAGIAFVFKFGGGEKDDNPSN